MKLSGNLRATTPRQLATIPQTLVTDATARYRASHLRESTTVNNLRKRHLALKAAQRHLISFRCNPIVPINA